MYVSELKKSFLFVSGLFIFSMLSAKESDIVYLSKDVDEWDMHNIRWENSVYENYCCPSNWSIKECITIDECDFKIMPQAKYFEPYFCKVKAGAHVYLEEVTGYGVKNGILFPVYRCRCVDGDNQLYGEIRGCDITHVSYTSSVKNKKGDVLTLYYQRIIPNFIREKGFSKSEIENDLNNYWTYEMASLRGIYENINICFNVNGKIIPAMFGVKGSIKPKGTLTLNYPLNMDKPVPVIVENYFRGGQGGGSINISLYYASINKDCATCDLLAEYDYLDTDGGPSGKGYHYYTKNGLVTYVYEVECGTVNINEQNIYSQDKSNRFEFNHVRTVSREPSGNSNLSVKIGQYLNPVDQLKMRKSGNMNGEMIYTLAPGTLVKVIEIGDKAVVDGLESYWVKIKIINDVMFVEGYKTKLNDEGWVFAAYLQ